MQVIQLQYDRQNDNRVCESNCFSWWHPGHCCQLNFTFIAFFVKQAMNGSKFGWFSRNCLKCFIQSVHSDSGGVPMLDYYGTAKRIPPSTSCVCVWGNLFNFFFFFKDSLQQWSPNCDLYLALESLFLLLLPTMGHSSFLWHQQWGSISATDTNLFLSLIPKLEHCLLTSGTVWPLKVRTVNWSFV